MKLQILKEMQTEREKAEICYVLFNHEICTTSEQL